MEALTQVLTPLFEKERSLTRWVAMRGALLFLDMAFPDDETWGQLAPVMGIHPTTDPASGDRSVTVMGPQLDAQIEQNVVGTFWSITQRWNAYSEVAKMNIDQVNVHPEWSRVGPAVAMDHIAWTAVAFCRTGQLTSELIVSTPEPSRLDSPGWYVEPLFGKAERFWDGADWTEKVRVKNGRRYENSVARLK